MAIQSYTSPIDIKWNTDGQGNRIKIPIYNEQHMIAQGYFTLNQIPDYGDKVIINGLYEIDDGVPDATQFKVNYDMGIVNFHESHEGEVITINQYSGRGIWSVSSKKVYDDSTGQPIDANQTLQDFINKVKEYQYENWDSTKVYTPNKIVSYNGSTFICIQQTLNHEIPTNTDFWSVLAAGTSWKGIYNNLTQYELRDIVYYDEQKTIYYCIKRSLGNLPTNTEYWQSMISVLEETTYATQQGDYAKEQGNYAKNEGDTLANIIANFTYIEEYNVNTQYQPKNMVYYNGSTYINKVACQGINPSNSTYWQLIAAGYILRGNYSDLEQYHLKDIVFYGATNKLYECIQETTAGITPLDNTHWIEKMDVSNLIQLVNDYTNDITSLYVAHDVGVEITHNLNDYVTCHCVTINGGGYGHGGYGGIFGYGESPAYEVKSRVMYDITNPTNKIQIFLDEGFSGTPTITTVNSKTYDISFSNDVAELRVYLRTNS